MASTYVLGLGNVLMGDDGFGPAAVRMFERLHEVPPDVEVVDLGTPGLDLSPWVADMERIVIVDTIRTAQPPGTLRIYQKDEVLRHAPTARVSPHDPGVKETLLALEFAGRAPGTVVLIGVVPQSSDMTIELSGPVAAALPATVDAIVATLTAFGQAPTRRSTALASTPWWTPPAIAV